MTNTTTKTNKVGLTLKEVAAAREQNVPKVFNMVAALQAAKEAPLGIKRASTGGAYTSVVRDILAAANTPLTMSQIQAAYFAGKGIAADKKEAKKIYEAVFQHSDACKNKGVDTSKALFARDANNAYSLKASVAA